ncbi:hypothetical protein GcLGCM259_0769 [Glutamicibacter creatinolyticus]|uniref:Uncharacterized protein n=1 Tax=Glutamicibacter creatinolyticus TaxID=162496 RepID=A0A5B7WTF4_9MICC|nr:hypothetical protein [Glutamicibacter creatinolyticus]QCY46525.1 hypothetical protein GcLGCM259_0769 [Glutamicibacter creatinolyticus]
MSQDPDAHFTAQRPARVRVQAPADAAVDLQVPSAEHSAENFYVRQLIRSQLRLAVSVASGIIVLLVGITVLLSYWPQISQITLARIPLPWWILGLGVYPLILIAGVLYNISAVRNEKRYRSIAR